jgi:hypothetical protein
VQDPVIDPPSTYAAAVTPAIDDAVLTALSPPKETRPATALDFRALLARACPAAVALEERRVAELLHAVLGEEMVRVADRMPEEVSVRMGLDSTSTTTLGAKAPRKSGELDQALETLTNPAGYDPKLAERLKSEPTPSGLHELLGAASVELMEEATSTTVDANAIADYLGHMSSAAAEVEAAPRRAGKAPLHPAMDAIAEPEDPTDQLSRTALSKIHDSLAEIAKKRQRASDPDVETYDERPSPALLRAGGRGDLASLADDSSDVSTIDEKRPVLPPKAETTEELDVDDILTVTPSSPPPPIADTTVSTAMPGSDPFAASTDISPNPPAFELLGMTRETASPSPPERRLYSDSEPPTTVYDGHEGSSLPASLMADRLALLAGVAVAVLLLATIAGYLLF